MAIAEALPGDTTNTNRQPPLCCGGFPSSFRWHLTLQESALFEG